MYIFSLAVKLTTTLAKRLGLRTELITCLPVHKKVGFKMVGGGRFINSLASVNQESIAVNYCLVKKTSLLVMRKEVVRKSCMSAIIGYPLLGVTIFCVTPIKCKV